MVKDHINQYNYTLNPIGIFNSIKFMYTYYPDPTTRLTSERSLYG